MFRGYLAVDRGVNEPHDALDYHNMFLGGVLPVPGGTNIVIPSFHRDRLYMDQTAGLTLPAQANQIRQFSFRPVFIDSGRVTPTGMPIPTDFSTADATFSSPFVDATGTLTNPVNSAMGLDVDSDNDGVLDSVWIDIGLPDQSDASGTRFRPLVAYRVVDLDGRLNVNAHGSFADQFIFDATLNRAKPVASRGAGYGVAEVSLGGLFTTGTDMENAADYLSLLSARYDQGVNVCLLYTSPSPRDKRQSRMPSSA